MSCNSVGYTRDTGKVTEGKQEVLVTYSPEALEMMAKFFEIAQHLDKHLKIIQEQLKLITGAEYDMEDFSSHR